MPQIIPHPSHIILALKEGNGKKDFKKSPATLDFPLSKRPGGLKYYHKTQPDFEQAYQFKEV
jgi:hypothetical protein